MRLPSPLVPSEELHLKLCKVAAIAALTAVLLSLNSCGTLRRAGKDLYILGASPVLIPMAAASDAYSTSVEVRKGYGGDSWSEVLAFPFMWLWHVTKHTIYVGAHVVDLPVTLVLTSWSELSEYGPEIEPLDYYHIPGFDKELTDKSSTDAESGDTTESKR